MESHFHASNHTRWEMAAKGAHRLEEKDVYKQVSKAQRGKCSVCYEQRSSGSFCWKAGERARLGIASLSDSVVNK